MTARSPPPPPLLKRPGSCGPDKGLGRGQDPVNQGRWPPASATRSLELSHVAVREEQVCGQRGLWSCTAGPEPAGARHQAVTQESAGRAGAKARHQQALPRSATTSERFSLFPRVWILKLNKPSAACVGWGFRALGRGQGQPGAGLSF